MLELISTLVVATGLTVSNPSVAVYSETGMKTIMIDNVAVRGSIQIVKTAESRVDVNRHLYVRDQAGTEQESITTQSIIGIDTESF